MKTRGLNSISMMFAVGLMGMHGLMGCSHEEEPFRAIALDGPASGYIRLADDIAQGSIDSWNKSPFAERFDRTLSMSDYKREAKIGCDEGYAPWPRRGEYRPMIRVNYHLIHGVGVLDGPNDFDIWIFLDNNQRLLMGGGTYVDFGPMNAAGGDKGR